MSRASIFAGVAAMVLIVPQIAFAAWWNPFSWGVWHFFGQTSSTQQIKTLVSTTTTPELSETQQLRREVDDLKKQLNTSGQSKNTTDIVKQAIPVQAAKPTTTNSPSTIDYRPQILTILNTAKANYIELLQYSDACASMVSKRKAQIIGLMSPGRGSTLPDVAFDSYLTKVYTLFYDAGDNEIAAMEEYRVYCGKTVPTNINNNISKINDEISAMQTSGIAKSSSDLVSYQAKYFSSNYIEDTKLHIKDVIDRANKFINTSNSQYSQILEMMSKYVSNTITPSSPTSYNVPSAPTIPPTPKTTSCTISGDGVGLQTYVNCFTY